MLDQIHYTLLQVRNADDPMRQNEVDAFARVLQTPRQKIRVFDLLAPTPIEAIFDVTDVFLLGGSGHYSVAGSGAWLDRALQTLRAVYDSGRPTFASCWGFQAMARAMGGAVVNDLPRAEVGTHKLFLTEAGRNDPVFRVLGDSFSAQMGHEDRVVRLPPGATLLASSELVENQAYRFDERPIYCTQFHSELNCSDLLARVEAYPHYVERIAGVPHDEFCRSICETPETEKLLRRFVEWALHR